jgi:hypothetical protein
MAGGEYGGYYGNVINNVTAGNSAGYSGWGEYGVVTITPNLNQQPNAWVQYQWQQPMQPFQPLFTEEMVRMADGWDSDENI